MKVVQRICYSGRLPLGLAVCPAIGEKSSWPVRIRTLRTQQRAKINANRHILGCPHFGARQHKYAKFLCIFSFEIITKQKQLVKTENSNSYKKQKLVSFFCQIKTFYGEFDPGSGRTLAACLTHASRTMKHLRVWISGERVRNTWRICPPLWDNSGKPGLIPNIET